jgi:hypothetical protein
VNGNAGPFTMRVILSDAVNGNAGPFTMRVILSDAVNGNVGPFTMRVILSDAVNGTAGLILVSRINVRKGADTGVCPYSVIIKINMVFCLYPFVLTNRTQTGLPR